MEKQSEARWTNKVELGGQTKWSLVDKQSGAWWTNKVELSGQTKGWFGELIDILHQATVPKRATGGRSRCNVQRKRETGLHFEVPLGSQEGAWASDQVNDHFEETVFAALRLNVLLLWEPQR